MPEYIPSPRDWVREQVALYESSGGAQGTTLRDTGLPVIIVTHSGNKTGAIRKTPLMRVKDGDRYVLVASLGGAPKNPVWVHNLRANPHVEVRDETVVRPMREQLMAYERRYFATQERRDRSAAQHGRIVDALEAGDHARAGELIRENFTTALPGPNAGPEGRIEG